MRRSITSVGTKRPLLGLLLLAELILAVTLLGMFTPGGSPAATAAPAPLTTPTASLPASSTVSLPDGRTAQFIGLGEHTAPLLTRIGSQIGDAAEAVTAFWGTDWRRDIVIVASGSDEQFAALAGGGADIAAATTGERIVFAPGAAAMSDSALRIVLRHELFHYATRAATASDAPRWLTEGVADFVGAPAHGPAGIPAGRVAGGAAHRRRSRQSRRGPIAGVRPRLVVQPVRRRPVRHSHAACAVPERLRGGPSRRREPPSTRRSARTWTRCWPAGGSG